LVHDFVLAEILQLRTDHQIVDADVLAVFLVLDLIHLGMPQREPDPADLQGHGK